MRKEQSYIKQKRSTIQIGNSSWRLKVWKKKMNNECKDQKVKIIFRTSARRINKKNHGKQE